MKRNNKNMNIFMKYINDKISYRFFFKRIAHNISVFKFRHNILNGSPSFNILWQMADFIKLAEKVFFHTNTTDSDTYSSINYVDGQNGFIMKGSNVKIIVKLYKETRKVVVEVYRIIASNHKTTLCFTDNEWENNPTIYDEMLLESVIKIINNNIIDLFDKCYAKM